MLGQTQLPYVNPEYTEGASWACRLLRDIKDANLTYDALSYPIKLLKLPPGLD